MVGSVLSLLLLLPAVLLAQEPDWSFPDDDLEQRLAEVSEGELVLLQTAPAQPVHHHRNNITISESSLQDGWVILEQCHQHLDPVAELEIVYHPERIRKLVILSTEAIGASRVVGAKVQLSDVGHNARLCLRAESRALNRLGTDRYRLRNGPYMRRFLDGYFPMRVTLEIDYPPAQLELTGFRPQPGASGHMQQQPGRVHWDSWFKGALFTEFDFQHRQQP